jgi:hypothetical protein
VSLHLPHHIPHADGLLSLLYALMLLAAIVAIWWVATYGGGPVPS